ncbi:anti sigma factor C-terminal domain-containing protein [Paenibacillus dokdonensis]|uniref:Anti sigma factor C-terminal domain-containing protein n=1 Tax=Paenibacillus dokdonensis TaxID=2567944 RepID=A0ABU6GJ72_9BACL|nr:anti sigma factor C-terminal domain-containing protein [Paenibacillus dokdonensis]MEC0239258.1 anti sigma factor C-terminal domain-containing protein [Paenibacillus dokdonensis]
MSDDFKRKLQDYRDGKLPDEEKLELEHELEKMEFYQSYLDEMLDSEEDKKNTGQGKLSAEERKMHKREARLLRKGKWKARFGTVLTLISLFIWFTFLSSIGTALFYSLGNPGFGNIDRHVIVAAIAVGYPNMNVQVSSDAGPYFNMKVKSPVTKRVGAQNMEIGNFSASFLFNWMRLYDFSWSDSDAGRTPLFQYPGKEGFSSDQEWKRLDKLPEGTVAEAFVSYNRLYTTDEILKQFKGKDMDPVWFAVDNGEGSGRRNNGVMTNPIGFPTTPVWFPEDGKVSKSSEQKTGFLSLTSISMTSYPAVDTYGSGDIRNENFIKTLRMLVQHKLIAKRLIPFVDMKETLDYVEKNGVKIYGAVVTGPTKEILKLKDEPEVSGIQVGKVTLWNWYQ